MGETATNIATLNMNDALKVRVKDGCEVEDPCSSSPCPPHSSCHNTWDGYSCVCDRGGRPPAAGGHAFGALTRRGAPSRVLVPSTSLRACGAGVWFVTEEGPLCCLFTWGQGHSLCILQAY